MIWRLESGPLMAPRVQVILQDQARRRRVEIAALSPRTCSRRSKVLARIPAGESLVHEDHLQSGPLQRIAKAPGRLRLRTLAVVHVAGQPHDHPLGSLRSRELHDGTDVVAARQQDGRARERLPDLGVRNSHADSPRAVIEGDEPAQEGLWPGSGEGDPVGVSTEMSIRNGSRGTALTHPGQKSTCADPMSASARAASSDERPAIRLLRAS